MLRISIQIRGGIIRIVNARIDTLLRGNGVPEWFLGADYVVGIAAFQLILKKEGGGAGCVVGGVVGVECAGTVACGVLVGVPH